MAIRLRPMTFFNPVFHCQTPIVIRRLKTQADEGLGPQPKAGDSSRRSWLCRSASAPSQQACEPVQDRCLGPCSRPRHAAAWRSRNRAPAGWVAWATNSITEGRARFRIGSQWFSRSGCWNRRASSEERAIAVESRIDKLSSGLAGPFQSCQLGRGVHVTGERLGALGRGTGCESGADSKAAIDRPGSLSRLVNGDREGAIAIGSAKLDVAEHEFRFALRLDAQVLRLEATASVPRLDLDLAAILAQASDQEVKLDSLGVRGGFFFLDARVLAVLSFRRSGILTFSTWRGLVGAGFL